MLATSALEHLGEISLSRVKIVMPSQIYRIQKFNLLIPKILANYVVGVK
jgi:hypothetical protein